jgi:hypothetical protein
MAILAICTLAPLKMIGQFGPRSLGRETKKKFYITGLAHSAEVNDCTIPPIVAFGTDRVDALLHCCEGGGLTVWTEEERKQFRKEDGKQFDEGCAALKAKKP